MVNHMKNNKKTWLGAVFTFALVAIMGLTFAFKPVTSNNANRKAPVWYQYQLSTFTDAQVKNPLNYQRVNVEPGCDETENICSIQLENTGDNPTFDSSTEAALVAAQNHTSTPAPNIKMQD